MTIKEAFEALSSACAKGMKNPFFVMKRLKESFADVADKVVDAGGDTVTVTPIVESGTKIAEIAVNNVTKELYTPVLTPLHVYDEDEHLVGRWFHDNIAEDVYEITKDLSNISTDGDNPTIIMPAGNKIISVQYSGIYNVDGEDFVITDDEVIVSYSTINKNLQIVILKVESNYISYRLGNGTLKSLIATYRYTKASS